MGREVIGEEEGETRTTERAVVGEEEGGDKNNGRGSDTGRRCYELRH